MIYLYKYLDNISYWYSLNQQSMSLSPTHSSSIDGKDIKKLLKTGKLFKITILNNSIVFPIMGFILMIGLYINMSFTKPIETLLYGIPNSILFSIFCLYVCNICFIQLFYFYIICLFLKIKINSLNERLIEMNRSKQFMRIRGIFKAFD